MKTRRDFVSNSSSSSFILRGECAARGIRLLRLVAELCEIPYEVKDEIALRVYALGEDMPRLSTELEKCALGAKPPWNYILVPLSNAGLSKFTDKALEKIDSVEFYLGDGSAAGATALKLLYMFFQRNECRPDAYNSEQRFLCRDCAEDFMHALAFGAPAEKEDGK